MVAGSGGMLTKYEAYVDPISVALCIFARSSTHSTNMVELVDSSMTTDAECVVPLV